ncbi:MAG: hypothetical protein WBA13_10800 [Microcoleaceae cyanobacterium]
MKKVVLPLFSGLTALLITGVVMIPIITTQSKPVSADVEVSISDIKSQLTTETSVPILLPNQLPFELEPIYFNSETTSNGYSVEFWAVPDCQGATACYLGHIEVEKNGEFQPIEPDLSPRSEYKKVTLANNIEGVFYNGCGAYCTAYIEFKYQNALYRVVLKNGTQADLEQIASNMIVSASN